MSTYAYDFEIPGRTPTLNEFLRWHWTKQRQHTKDMAWMVLQAVGADKNRVPIARCTLRIERYSHGHGRVDWDNLLGGMKSLCDSLTARHPSGIGLIEDDDTDCIITIPTIIPVSIRKKEPERTRIQIMKVIT